MVLAAQQLGMIRNTKSFNSNNAEKNIVVDFALFGVAFQGAQVVVFDVHEGKDVEGMRSGHCTSGSIAGHGCQFIVLVFQ